MNVDLRHGRRYTYWKHRCRCELCVGAQRSYMRSLRQSPAPPSHGSSGYRNYGCRCATCRAAGSVDNRAQYERRKSLADPP